MNRPLTIILSAVLFAPYSFADDVTGTTTESAEGPTFRVNTQGHAMFLNVKDSEDAIAKATYEFLHENKVTAELNDFQGDIQFTNRWNPNGSPQNNSYFTLEKKSLNYVWSTGRVTLGDSQQELGKGVALSLYRDSNFGVDNTLEGIALKQTFAPITFGAMAGRVNAIKNPVAVNPTLNPLLDREVWLASTQVSGKLSSDVQVGGHYLYTSQRSLETRKFEKNWHTVGANFTVSNLLDSIDLYGETNTLLTYGMVDNKSTYPTGWGTFVSAAWSQESWRIKLEGKDYRQYYYDFRRAPTLEDEVVATLNTQDVTATRLSIERSLAPKTSVYSSFLIGSDRAYREELRHGVVGGKFLGPFGSAIELKGGYRWAPHHSNFSHVSSKFKLPTLKGQSVELEYRKQIANKNLNTYRVIEDRNQTNLTYNFSERWNLGVGYEFVPTNPEPVQAHFFNAQSTYKAGPYQAKAFVGQTSGGTMCSGGVCRTILPFSGAYLEGSYSF